MNLESGICPTVSPSIDSRKIYKSMSSKSVNSLKKNKLEKLNENNKNESSCDIINTRNNDKNEVEVSKETAISLKRLRMGCPNLQSKLYSAGAFCRICYEKGKKNDPLIVPCSCEGSIKFVHKSCIKKWILNSEQKISEAKCEICHTKFVIKKNNVTHFDKMRCRRFVRNLIAFIIGISLIIFGFLVGIYNILLMQKVIVTDQKKKFFGIGGFIGFIIVIIISSLLYMHYHEKLLNNEKSFEVMNMFKKPRLNVNVSSSSITLGNTQDGIFIDKDKIVINNFFVTNKAPS